MTMNALLIDVGNTNIKWARLSSCGLHDYGSCAWKDGGYRQALGKLGEYEQPDQVLVSSVLIPGESREINDAVMAMGWPEPAWFSKPSDTKGGIDSVYIDHDTLGIDRYLSMLSAFHEVRDAVIVVDAGTATTIDAISASGQHLGGIILPGLAMVGHSLLGDIPRFRGLDILPDRLPLDPFQNNTKAGLTQGIGIMWSGGIRLALDLMRQKLMVEPEIYITGGDAGCLGEFITDKVHVDPLLVLKGLAMQAGNN